MKNNDLSLIEPAAGMPTGREVLEVLQNAGVNPKAGDDLRGALVSPYPAIAIAADPSVGDEMPNSAGEPGAHHILCR